MRREDKEIKDRGEIEKILRESKVCRLAMVDGSKPYIVPMNFGYHDSALYFHSAPEGRKIDVIRKNNNICFEVDQIVQFKKAKLACDWSLTYKSVIGEGKARIIHDPEEKIKGLDIIMAQYSDRTFKYPLEKLAETAVIKVEIDDMTGKQS